MLYQITDKNGRIVLEYTTKDKANQILDCLNAFAFGTGNSYTLVEIKV